jgi:hypothetical protein
MCLSSHTLNPRLYYPIAWRESTEVRIEIFMYSKYRATGQLCEAKSSLSWAFLRFHGTYLDRGNQRMPLPGHWPGRGVLSRQLQ